MSISAILKAVSGNEYKQIKKRVEKDMKNSVSERLVFDISKVDTVETEGEDIGSELILKEYKLRQSLHYFLQNSLYRKLRTRLPRSEFAGIREEFKNYKIKRTNRLRKSLDLQNSKFGSYVFELDGSILGYPDLINRDQKYITYKYWDKITDLAYEEIFANLKNKESILNVRVRKR